MIPADSDKLGASIISITGLHLWEFSSFGFLLMVAPCVVILMSKMYTKMQNTHFILFGILMLALIGYNNGIIEAGEWIRTMTDGAVQYERTMVVYPILLIMSTSILMIHMNFVDFFDEFEKAFAGDYEPEEAYYDSFSR